MMGNAERFVRLRAGVMTDPYSGQPAPDWTSPGEVSFMAGFSPGESSEITVGDSRLVTTDQPKLYIDEVGLDITEDDRVRRVRTGVEYAVDGKPREWRGAFVGLARGTVVVLKDIS